MKQTIDQHIRKINALVARVVSTGNPIAAANLRREITNVEKAWGAAIDIRLNDECFVPQGWSLEGFKASR